jgi:hypothetical protein
MSQLKPTHRPDVWSFETDAMEGELKADAQAHVHGVTSLVQKSTGRQVVQENLFCLHLYRVLTRNHWLSQCRDVPHAGVLEGDELVIRWPEDALGPGLEGEARYRVSSDNSLDLAVTLTNTGRWHRALELYTSNYFAPSLHPGLYTVTPFVGPASTTHPAVLTRPVDSPATRFCYHVWPRDVFGAQSFTDGRWEYGTHSPVPWAIGRWFAYPLGFYATDDRETLAVVMARPDDCFAMCTSYHSDDPDDGVAHHNSLYHSLIGADAGPGWQRTVRQRLVLTDWADEEAPLQACEAFL